MSSPSTVFPTYGYRGGGAVDTCIDDALKRFTMVIPSTLATLSLGNALSLGDATSLGNALLYERRPRCLARAVHVALFVWLMGRFPT